MKKLFISLIVGVILSITAFASQYVTYNNFSQFYNLAQSLGKQYGPQNVLLVYDIDCTLLTAKQQLGSDIWFNWQSQLMATDPNSKYLVSKDFNQMLQDQIILNYFYPLYPTESTMPQQFSQLQNQGFKNLILSARGSAWEQLTEQQMANAGFNVQKNEISNGFTGTYMPYNLSNISGSGLTAQDVSIAKLKNPRTVSFENGIFYASGQNKGIILKTLLAKLGQQYKAIIFIDDTKANTDNMWAIYQNDPTVNMNCVRYSYDDSLKAAFAAEDKTQVYNQWLQFEQMDQNVFGTTTVPVSGE
ncbi:MAG: DUF2608 domain-containing protein [Fusobacteria bacterium]|nr:DUF2608 domain-containing protein [Fusobacteriota bacterium]